MTLSSISILHKRSSVLLVSLAVLVLDQVTKLIVVAFIPLTHPPTVVFNFFGDFFQIIHVRNPGALFSLGAGWSDLARSILFKILPIFVISWLALSISLTPQQQQKLFHLKKTPQDEFPGPSRWAAALIVGGGFGNIIDRIFRKHGVVDFLDFKFYWLFGLERWPTFNIADASIVIGIALLVILLFFERTDPR